jgi:hypothetical protein
MLICFNAFSQTTKNKECFSMNPFIDAFIENLIDKDVNLNQNHVTLISLVDKDGNYNIDLELKEGGIEALKSTSPREVVLRYGNMKVVVIGKTGEDLKFLKKSIRKINKVFNNKDTSKNNLSFYDEDYVWSIFFDKKMELINLYIPEEKESAYKIFDGLKSEVKISTKFKYLDCNFF